MKHLSKVAGTGWNAKLMQVWALRSLNILAIGCGLFLLFVDSPLSAHLPVFVPRPVVEAMPLLLVGVAFLAWLAIDRPPVIDFIKQAFIALAFILWGIDLLLPIGKLATFIGALVIAIYVFDLAWLMEGNLRKKFEVRPIQETTDCTSADCRSGGVCGCQGDRRVSIE